MSASATLARDMSRAFGALGFDLDWETAASAAGRAAAVVVDLDGFGSRWKTALEARVAAPDSVLVALTMRRDPTSDVVRAFKAGLDDYVVGPMDLELLAARVAALLRLRDRMKRERREPELATKDGRLTLDAAGRRSWLGAGSSKREMALTRIEFDVLAYLLGRKNRVVARRELLEAVWSEGTAEDPSRTLVQHILHLRSKLGPVGRRLETVRGLGYRFID